MDRIQKALAQAGVCSRREAERLILARRVRVNGETVQTLGLKVDPTRDRIEVDGQPVEWERAEEPRLYLALHKPVGVVSTARDPQGRPTVIDLLTGIEERVYPVGRLDRDSEGLLLMTNDGSLAHRLTHPSYEVEKVYRVEVTGTVSPADLATLRRGVKLNDGVTHPARARLLREGHGRSLIEIAIHEGRNRQVRRMMDAIGHRVTRLQRIRIGPIHLDRLPVGAFRRLTPREVHALKQSVGL